MSSYRRLHARGKHALISDSSEWVFVFFFFQAEDGIRDYKVTGVQTCALPISPARDRRQIERHPPDILITTPESLFLLLTSAARRILPSIRWVIVDEIHSMADTKRGAHLALSLERLSAITKTEPQRIGLSATQRPLSETARFLGGTNREGTIIDAGRVKPMEITVEVPVDDMSDWERGTEVYSGPAAANVAGRGGTLGA